MINVKYGTVTEMINDLNKRIDGIEQRVDDIDNDLNEICDDIYGTKDNGLDTLINTDDLSVDEFVQKVSDLGYKNIAITITNDNYTIDITH